MRMKEIYKIAISIGVLFFSMLIMAVFSKFKLISEATSIAFFVFVFMILSGSFIVALVKRKRSGDYEDIPETGLDTYIRKINRILESRPGGDSIYWEGGIYSRYLQETFFDVNRQAHKFIGLVAMLRNKQRRIVTIYDAKEDDIVRFIGDPSPDQLNDPFFNFKPFRNAGRAFSPMNEYAMQRRNHGGGVNFNFGQRG